ncbi:hypothetical protein EYF80_047359 [Liparis tanakae]|uniref:Uncharacterized protein n=1 Tax=Liparis tanakae TaxID=230148 RepID=A0A4Z2FNW6_9TELE|nr:hypothetical protein EYF80_047359 [Liparis tanakae]
MCAAVGDGLRIGRVVEMESCCSCFAEVQIRGVPLRPVSILPWIILKGGDISTASEQTGRVDVEQKPSEGRQRAVSLDVKEQMKGSVHDTALFTLDSLDHHDHHTTTTTASALRYTAVHTSYISVLGLAPATTIRPEPHNPSRMDWSTGNFCQQKM